MRTVVQPALDARWIPFFEVHNTGVQLHEEEGYNCGLYCALWARDLLQDVPVDFELPRWSQKQLRILRLRWEVRLQRVAATAAASRGHVVGLSELLDSLNV